MGTQHRALDDVIARGNTSDVLRWSPTAVVKLLHPGIPREWAALEAEITMSVHACGLPVPETAGTVEIDGRPGIVFEYIRGESMWDRMKAAPADLVTLTEDLIHLQIDLHAAPVTDGIPDLVTRLRDKIALAERLSPEERGEALAMLTPLPTGRTLCHGDMHPGNVLMSPSGMVVIDWFDAAIGHETADFVRSSLLMRSQPSHASTRSQLGGTHRSFLARLRGTYLGSLTRKGLLADEQMTEWESVLAVARMSEPVPTDDLVRIWRSRPGVMSPTLYRTIEFRPDGS